MASYCSQADLYSFGLPRGGTPNPGRLASTVESDDDTIELDVHGFSLGDPVRLRAESGGALPAPLTAGATYYAVPVDESHFKLSATAGDGAIDFTADGTRVVVIAPLPIDAAILWASRIIDDMLPAHAVPLEEPYHELIIATCAELAAGKLLALRGSASKSLGEMIQYAQKRLERWGKGVPLRGANVPPAANLAVGTSAPHSDTRGWSRYGGL